ncbi:MAG: LptA/OstA family protein [Elusimicrobiota bacterium]|nr:LptA/OstA family protein [Elusimicrobiota bacterium]
MRIAEQTQNITQNRRGTWKWFLLLLTHLLTYSLTLCLYAGEPATITGNKMKMLQKGDILEFIGNVKLVQQNLTITADKMKSNEKTGMVEGYGSITVRYSSGTENTYAWGDTAEYNKNSGSGIFTGNVKIKRTLSKPPSGMDTNVINPGRDDKLSDSNGLNLTCEELEIFEFGDRYHAIKNVQINQEYTVATSSEAFYDHKTKEIFLTGGPPKIIRTDEKGHSEYSGDKIAIVTDKEKFTVLGNVRTKMVMK